MEVHVAPIVFTVRNAQLCVLTGKRKDSKAVYPGFWEFGGGKMCPNETFENAVKRETKEEFGVDVKVIEPFAFFRIELKDGRVVPGVRIICVCTDLNNLKSESLEHDVIRCVPVVNVSKMCRPLIPGLMDDLMRARERLFDMDRSVFPDALSRFIELFLREKITTLKGSADQKKQQRQIYCKNCK